jgi:hypothetical protein
MVAVLWIKKRCLCVPDAQRVNRQKFETTMRIFACCIVLVFGLVSTAICWAVLEMKNVYLRPVLVSVETGKGDPFMFALDCVAQLSLIALIVSMICLFVFAVRNRPSTKSPTPS